MRDPKRPPFFLNLRLRNDDQRLAEVSPLTTDEAIWDCILASSVAEKVSSTLHDLNQRILVTSDFINLYYAEPKSKTKVKDLIDLPTTSVSVYEFSRDGKPVKVAVGPVSVSVTESTAPAWDTTKIKADFYIVGLPSLGSSVEQIDIEDFEWAKRAVAAHAVFHGIGNQIEEGETLKRNTFH